jgi:hypothetical protein
MQLAFCLVCKRRVGGREGGMDGGREGGMKERRMRTYDGLQGGTLIRKDEQEAIEARPDGLQNLYT